MTWNMRPIRGACAKAFRVLRCDLDGIDEQDLVQHACAHVLRYVGESTEDNSALVFQAALNASYEYIRRWRNQSKTRAGYGKQPDVSEIQEHHRSVPPPPIELMIDLARELLRQRLPGAYAWVVCRLHGDPYSVVCDELGYTRAGCRALISRTESQLRDALREYEPSGWGREQLAKKLLLDGVGSDRARKIAGVSHETVRRLRVGS